MDYLNLNYAHKEFYRDTAIFHDSARGEKRRFFYKGITREQDPYELYEMPSDDITPAIRSAADANFIRWEERTLLNMAAPADKETAKQIFSIITGSRQANKRDYGTAILRCDLNFDTARPMSFDNEMYKNGVNPHPYVWGYLKDGSQGAINLYEQGIKYLFYHRHTFQKFNLLPY
jgi:hypothetical protein